MIFEFPSSSFDPDCGAPCGSVFIVSASYEDRSLFIASKLPMNCRFCAGLVYVNEEFLTGHGAKVTKNNMERLAAFLEQRCDVVRMEVGSWIDPLTQLAALKALVSHAREACAEFPTSSFLVDTSTFTRESLVVCCTLLRQEKQPSLVRLFYAASGEHGAWLSRGFRCVRNIIGYAGVQVPGAPNVLIVLSGFESERTVQLIEEHEPSRVLLGIGNPPTNSSFLDRNWKEQELVLARQNVETFEFPVRSVAECVTCLEKIVMFNLPTSNITIAPMNTKLSTIAAMLIADRHPQIQLTYCLPGEYNTEAYSKGVKEIYVEDI